MSNTLGVVSWFVFGLKGSPQPPMWHAAVPSVKPVGNNHDFLIGLVIFEEDFIEILGE